MTTTKFKIILLESDPENGYVTTVHWQLEMQEEEQIADTYGSVSYATTKEPYVPYAELTEEGVIQWVKDYLGEPVLDAMLTDLKNQLNELSKPSKTIQLPWQN